jgi:uncharacterized protein YbjT (DUF2867 family)
MAVGDSPILVTGGTGKLGRPTVARLLAAGHDVRVLSRKPGAGRILGDLNTGAGLEEAVHGVRSVLHLTSGGTKEAEHTKRVALAAREAGVEHLIYISIVGVDRNPFPYYRAKLRSEQAVRAVGVPFTILRATQFHEFVAALAGGKSKRIAFVPEIPLQPIAVDEVAARLVELVAAGPSGRVADVGGPEQALVTEFAAQWYAARGHQPRVARLAVPGKSFRAFRAGAQLATLPGYGRQTFAEWARAAQTVAS